MDSETQKLQTDADKVIGMLNSDGWQVIHAKLNERIIDLQNINNIDTSDPATLGAQVAARILASQLLFDFLKKDVYGFVEQQSVNAAVPPPKDDEIIERNT